MPPKSREHGEVNPLDDKELYCGNHRKFMSIHHVQRCHGRYSLSQSTLSTTDSASTTTTTTVANELTCKFRAVKVLSKDGPTTVVMFCTNHGCVGAECVVVDTHGPKRRKIELELLVFPDEKIEDGLLPPGAPAPAAAAAPW